MADTKTSGLAAATTVASDDLAMVIDRSDVTMAATGTNKKIALSDLFGRLPVNVGLAVGKEETFYNVDVDASNYERAYGRWVGNVFEIGTEKAGTGTQRKVRLKSSAGEGHALLLEGSILWGEYAGSIGGRSGIELGSSRIHAPNSGVRGGNGAGIGFVPLNPTLPYEVPIYAQSHTKLTHGFGSSAKDAIAGYFGDGNNCDFFGGNGSSVDTGGLGGDARLLGGKGMGTGNNNGGNVVLEPGLPSGTGKRGEIKATDPIGFKVYTVAALPAGLTIGSRAMVSDALTPTFGAVVVGGGAVLCPVYYDGAAWRVG